MVQYDAVGGVDCKWSEWSRWGPSCPCGTHEQIRTRNITVEAENGGKLCCGGDVERRQCRKDCEFN